MMGVGGGGVIEYTIDYNRLMLIYDDDCMEISCQNDRFYEWVSIFDG